MDLSHARWRKSARSGSSGGQCVEVTMDSPGMVGVRDSKDPGGPVVMVSSEAWRAFVGRLKGTTHQGG